MALLQKMTCEDKACYDSTPRCIVRRYTAPYSSTCALYLFAHNMYTPTWSSTNMCIHKTKWIYLRTGCILTHGGPRICVYIKQVKMFAHNMHIHAWSSMREYACCAQILNLFSTYTSSHLICLAYSHVHSSGPQSLNTEVRRKCPTKSTAPCVRMHIVRTYVNFVLYIHIFAVDLSCRYTSTHIFIAIDRSILSQRCKASVQQSLQLYILTTYCVHMRRLFVNVLIRLVYTHICRSRPQRVKAEVRSEYGSLMLQTQHAAHVSQHIRIRVHSILILYTVRICLFIVGQYIQFQQWTTASQRRGAKRMCNKA